MHARSLPRICANEQLDVCTWLRVHAMYVLTYIYAWYTAYAVCYGKESDFLPEKHADPETTGRPRGIEIGIMQPSSSVFFFFRFVSSLHQADPDATLLATVHRFNYHLFTDAVPPKRNRISSRMKLSIRRLFQHPFDTFFV